tara:strand:- start:225 stop:1268 length:1044 start_codon:yes stop_codon:yes gene_type:complete
MINSAKKLKIFHLMKLIRFTQQALIDRYHPEDKMRCPMHFCLGQEITPAILGLLLKKNDSIYSHHRSHGFFISKGGSIKKLIAEFYGKETGTNGGLAGSQELSSPDIHFYSGTILSGALSLSIGDAFSKIYKKQSSISVAVIGDGGMEEGIVYETFNLASKMKLPTLFICENNLYSTHTHLRERVSNFKTHYKVKPFGLKTTYFNSNNPEKLYYKISKIINEIRKNKQPQFLEIQTYRFNGHVGPENDDIFNYRSKKEMQFWKKRDPLIYYKKKLQKEIKNFKKIEIVIEKRINKLIKDAFNFAEKSKFPKTFIDKNYLNSYAHIKKFYENKIKFKSDQEGHKPKPY